MHVDFLNNKSIKSFDLLIFLKEKNYQVRHYLYQTVTIIYFNIIPLYYGAFL